MQDNYSNTVTDSEIFDFFDKIEIPVSKSKEEVWESISAELAQRKPVKRIIFNQKLIIGLAASVLIFACTLAFLRFYTETVSNPFGQHLSASLPDGSSVELNAGSSLSYHPFWFSFSRNLQFEGEGFFEVEKGKTFTVESKLGRTIVVGTSFNIYSRSEKYNVFCMTGKVKVVSNKNSAVFLDPGQTAEVDVIGNIQVSENVLPNQTTSWRDNSFYFIGVPVQEVFEEIERQYNILLTSDPINAGLLYTGHFSNELPVEEVLDLVCKPFGIKFVQKTDTSYLLTQPQ